MVQDWTYLFLAMIKTVTNSGYMAQFTSLCFFCLLCLCPVSESEDESEDVEEYLRLKEQVSIPITPWPHSHLLWCLSLLLCLLLCLLSSRLLLLLLLLFLALLSLALSGLGLLSMLGLLAMALHPVMAAALLAARSLARPRPRSTTSFLNQRRLPPLPYVNC